MKEAHTKYTCDNCKKEKFNSDSLGFPYDNKWCYIYNFTGRVLESDYPGIELNVADFKNKDKHFCSEKCMFEWIKNTVKECKKECVKEQKKGSEEIAKLIWNDLQKDKVDEAIKTLKNSKLI